MNTSPVSARWHALLSVALFAVSPALAQRQVPPMLSDWQDWATWDAEHRDCPTPFNAAGKHLCFWPGKLSLVAAQESATWSLEVVVFSKTWVPLPGSAETWPLEVRVDGAPVAVVERGRRPCIELLPGPHRVAGTFLWDGEMPQRIRVPREVGMLSLSLEGRNVEIPNWDEAGHLWLKRVRAEATDDDAVTAQVWRVIEDGIPLWLRTEVELSVSGKSREEELGTVAPEGWHIAAVDAPVPVAVDDQGRMKAQVRAGKWRIRVDAFRTADAGEFKFARDARPVTATELVGFRALPEFRMAELVGLRVVDVSQTTFPDKWRSLPVYLWHTDQSFRLEEKMRGMGLQSPEGLRIRREFWLDENGRGLTFRDRVAGSMQQTWRLDIAEGQELGAAKIGGQAQLITANPANGAHGVEIRARNLDLQAIGRSDRVRAITATGWRSPADQLDVAMNLPPGWRLFALFGADWVDGDWLSAWTLLDLFLLLIFSLAVFKLWGAKAGLMAFLAFGLAYHEPGAPRLTWLFLLLPLALLRVVPQGGLRKCVAAWRYVAIALLVFFLVPFVARQVQSVIYPQLEQQGFSYGSHPLLGRSVSHSRPPRAEPMMAGVALQEAAVDESVRGSRLTVTAPSSTISQKRSGAIIGSNLLYDSKVKIQTGPAEPEWHWNLVRCGWNGPVSANEEIRPLLIPPTLHRVLTLLRVALLLMLGGLLLRGRGKAPDGPSPGKAPNATAATAAAALMVVMLAPAQSRAQLPDAQMLGTLRDRLLEPSDAYPRAAEIPSVDLRVADGRIAMTAEVHAAIQVAVPLPGKLPSWSPVTVRLDGAAESVLRRQDGFLWVVVPAGVHRVVVEGLIPDATEWEWTFLLKPRRVSIAAPGWTVTGVQPNGVPENQIFFARQRPADVGEAEYDRKDFDTIVVLDRHLEVGLVWQARTVVTRLSRPGKAVSLRVPLLAGEKVLSPGVIVEDGHIEMRLGAGDMQFAWDSELPVGEPIALTAEQTDRWVERWHLVTSPVWNASLSGLAPGFESSEENLVPIWQPWPGESVTLSFSKPGAVSGDTITVRRVNHEIALGGRQRTAKLVLDVEASLGDDFILELDPDARISSLTQDNRPIPVHRDGGNLVVPVHPGSQTLNIEWRLSEPLRAVAAAGQVTLPVEMANITTVMRVPESRWVLWASGPLRGPAVRFWTVLAVAILAAWVLGGFKLSPLRRFEWMLLALGLTQVHFAAASLVVGWFFLLAWRGKKGGAVRNWGVFDLLQLLLVGFTMLALGILVAAVGEGLLGNPEMFIRGNGSSRTVLRWFQPQAESELPMPYVVSVSVWFYRILMLAWALWLAVALIRWLKWAWMQFSDGDCWRRAPKKVKGPPPISGQSK